MEHRYFVLYNKERCHYVSSVAQRTSDIKKSLKFFDFDSANRFVYASISGDPKYSGWEIQRIVEHDISIKVFDFDPYRRC